MKPRAPQAVLAAAASTLLVFLVQFPSTTTDKSQAFRAPERPAELPTDGRTGPPIDPFHTPVSPAADGATGCWDQYNSRGTRKMSTLVPQGVAPEDCTPAPGCWYGYRASDGRPTSWFVPFGLDPSQACTEPLSEVAPAGTGTTKPATTTTQPATSQTVPASDGTGQFVETFDSAASLDGFVFQISEARAWPGDPKTFTGDHSLPDANGMCGGPTSTRKLTSGEAERSVPLRYDDAKVRELGLAYWCANGTGHFMTAMNTSGYAHFDFRPNRQFTDVKRVCWDQNITDMGGKWTEMAVVPVKTFKANGGRMDYTHPDRNGSNEPGGWGLKIDRGVFKAGFHGGQQTASVNQTTDRGSNDQTRTEDKALRTQHCVLDNGNGTVTTTRGKLDGTTQTDVLDGAFPDGDVVVIFSDVMYNPDKRTGQSGNEHTWHWDNIIIQ